LHSSYLIDSPKVKASPESVILW